MLPFGRLREARKGASRAHVIVVTKCTDLSAEEKHKIRSEIAHYAAGKPVFFSRIKYDKPVSMGSSKPIAQKVVLVTGIAKTDSLQSFCLDNYQIVKHFNFPDHHRYTHTDLSEIERFVTSAPDEVSVITTEKDMVKLIEPELKPFIDRISWFYLPIRHEFVEDGLKFDEIVLRSAGGA